MSTILNNAVSTKQKPISKKWIIANKINTKTATVLNFTGTGKDSFIQDNMPVLIDTSKVKPRTTASELFLVKRDNQKYFSWLNFDEHNNLIIRSIDNFIKLNGFVEVSEIIPLQNIKNEIEILGKVFPLENTKTIH